MTTTREKLERIPDLAAEVALTKDAPNPDGRVERHQLTFESKPPTDLAVLDALRAIDPDGWSITSLWHLAQGVKAAWAELRAAGIDVRTLPQLTELPTYSSEAGWLLATFDLWQTHAQEAAFEYIVECINDCHSELVRLAREPKAMEIECMAGDCHAPIRVTPEVGDDGKVTLHGEACEFGHPVDRHEIVRRIYRTEDYTLPELAGMLGTAVSTLYKWQRAGLLTAVSRNRSGDPLYSYEAAYRVVQIRIS